MTSIDLKVNIRRIDDGLAEVRCGRGGCGELLGHIHWAGMNVGVGRYSGPPMFQPLPGFRQRDDEILALTARAENQGRYMHRVHGQGSVERAAWGRRKPKDTEYTAWEEVTAAAIGQSSETSSRRLPPIGPLPSPVSIKCSLRKCGFINVWDGTLTG